MMHVLERLEGTTSEVLLAAPDRSSVERLFVLIVRRRSRASALSSEAHVEHLRAAAYRITVNSGDDEFLSLDGEHFRIRLDDSIPETSAPSTRLLKRIARRTPPPVSGPIQMSSAAVAVARTRSIDRSVDGDQFAVEQDTVIDRERFEL